MTGFTANDGAIGSGLLHAFFELSLVRIFMAGGARRFIPVVRGRFRLKAVALFVAVAARHRHVASSQREPGFFVTRQGERRWLVAFEVVAAVAGIAVRCSRELSGMLIAVAVDAELELDFE